jgi:sulfonate dioxygenase
VRQSPLPQYSHSLTCRTFGRLHTHPTSGQPKEYQQFHLVYRDGAGADGPGAASLVRNYYADKLTSTQWHSDVTYEEQPPGLTTLLLYATPESGGDTAYVSQVGQYFLS